MAIFSKHTLGLAMAATLAGYVPTAAADAVPSQPNVVFIFVDDIGYSDIGFQNISKDVVTPNLDQLAKDGAILSSGYVTAPVCAPSRAGLLTGRYQQRFGFHDTIAPFVLEEGVEQGLDTNVKTLGNYFQGIGYTTGLVGKVHDGDDKKFWPHNRGFTEYYGFNNGAADYFVGPDNLENNKTKPWGSVYRNNEPVAPFDDYLTDAFGKEAAAFIDRHHEKPFFLYVPFNASHAPMMAKESDLEKFKHIEDPLRRKFVAMTYNMDQNVGRIINKLNEHKLMEETIIIFMSDNGGIPNDNGSVNHPLHSTKNTLWEGGIRVPTFISWKGTIPANQVINEPMISLDILPTTLAAAGKEVEADWQLEGVNLLPLLKGEKKTLDNRYLFWRMPMQSAVRDNEWKLIIPNTKVAHPQPQLFKISEDISESNNVAEDYPQEVERLMNAYNDWDKDNLPSLWGWRKENYPYANGWRGRH